jgi:hypothetical protein
VGKYLFTIKNLTKLLYGKKIPHQQFGESKNKMKGLNGYVDSTMEIRKTYRILIG